MEGGRSPLVRRAIHDFEPDQAITDISPLAQLVHQTQAQPRFFTTILSSFGTVALLLAALGIFGVLSYNVRERTREIGIRMALGAARDDVLGMVFRQAVTLLGLGIGISLLGAIISGRLLSGLLYEVSGSDPVALLSAVTGLSAVALAAAIVPARRATCVDPIVALRYE